MSQQNETLQSVSAHDNQKCISVSCYSSSMKTFILSSNFRAVFNFVCVCVSHAECYSEASDHEEAESTEIPPPPYCEQTLRDSVDASGPPGSTHQVRQASGLRLTIQDAAQYCRYWILLLLYIYSGRSRNFDLKCPWFISFQMWFNWTKAFLIYGRLLHLTSV